MCANHSIFKKEGPGCFGPVFVFGEKEEISLKGFLKNLKKTGAACMEESLSKIEVARCIITNNN